MQQRKTKSLLTKRLEQYRRQNGTHIHADTIDHLDVSRVHNPINDSRRAGEPAGPATFFDSGRIKLYPVHTSFDAVQWFALDTERQDDLGLPLVIAQAASAREALQSARQVLTKAIKRVKNVLEKDAEHPIEVTRHYRSGGLNYLSPWQRAMAMGQVELFETGTPLSKRAAELRAEHFAKLKNLGVTKKAYQSGLKEATAAQLGRLARIGLRTGHAVGTIRADLRRTKRFNEEQIERGLEQARAAEEKAKKQNPLRAAKRNPSEVFDYTIGDWWIIALEYGDDSALTDEDIDALARFQAKLPRGGSWVYDDQAYFGRDQISGLKGNVVDAQYVVHKRNPSTAGKARKVKRLYQTFSGKKAKKSQDVIAPQGTPKQVAKLGTLRAIKTTNGKTWRFPGKDAPILAADHKQKLHIVGGRYRANPTASECGEIERIEYEASKPHLGHPTKAIYYHELGEDTGERPSLRIDADGMMHIDGGNYRLEADGIHN